jgi:hypothetical protein
MKRYYAAIFFNEKNETRHVNVYYDIKKAKEDAIENDGDFIAGINNIVDYCNWWSDNYSDHYKKNWVRQNAI